jgi:hypothetical protein
MISPERTKQIFVALRLHFTGSYDYIKYQGKTRAGLKPAETWAVEKIAYKFQNENTVRDFFVANMIDSYVKSGKIVGFIGSYANKEATEIYEKSTNWYNASYNLTSDLKKFDSLKDAVLCIDGNHPKIFQYVLDGEISIFTMACVMLQMGDHIVRYWNKNCDDTVLFGGYIQFLKKYVPLIPKDSEKIKETISSYNYKTRNT